MLFRSKAGVQGVWTWPGAPASLSLPSGSVIPWETASEVRMCSVLCACGSELWSGALVWLGGEKHFWLLVHETAPSSGASGTLNLGDP